jgi:hypothetical protein
MADPSSGFARGRRGRYRPTQSPHTEHGGVSSSVDIISCIPGLLILDEDATTGTWIPPVHKLGCVDGPWSSVACENFKSIEHFQGEVTVKSASVVVKIEFSWKARIEHATSAIITVFFSFGLGVIKMMHKDGIHGGKPYISRIQKLWSFQSVAES